MEELAPVLERLLENRFVHAGLVVAVAIIVATIARFALKRVLLGLARRTRSTIDDEIVQGLTRPVFLTLVWIGLYMALDILSIPASVKYWTSGVIKTFIILQWTLALHRITHASMKAVSASSIGGKWIEKRTLPLFENIGKLVLAGLALYLILNAWELDVKPWLASAGIAGIAIGFAAKDTLANLFGGLFILADAPYKLGDWVNLDSGERGMVTAIGLRSTCLLTRDDVEITVPNAVMANAKIANESGGPWVKARVTVRVGVAYGSDVDAVERVLLECAAAEDQVAREPAPRVRFTEFGDSSLNFRLLCWVEEPVLRGRVLHALNTAVYKAFRRGGIEIPFPQRVVHMSPPAAENASG